MGKNKKIYFASDAHLGYPSYEKSLKREKLFVKWLDEIKSDAQEIYLLGDIFDFWFEYKKVIPRGFSRFLGKICELTDKGIVVYFFTGNHDLWVTDYLPKETGVILQRNPVTKIINGKKFFLAHGDGLGPGDKGYKRLKKIFTNPILHWLFSRLHPNVAFAIAHSWSISSREAKGLVAEEFKGVDKENLVIYAKEELKYEHFDYMIFGHRHVPIDLKLNNKCQFINLGDWITHFTYAVFDGDKLELKEFK
ncbi:MAG: UDP-2,3-diacylglucosamine diphosphatase [Bacteroidetes bacterium]|nr:MAG: UDP-2,3-diacylglucosamine diphosphatase [Bacteroidota bacterium]